MIKLGYAFLIQRKQGVARKFFNKALSLAENKQINTLQFSANIASGLSYFIECKYEKAHARFNWCRSNLEYGGADLSHFYNSLALYHLYTGDAHQSIINADICIDKCGQSKKTTERNLFMASAWHIRGAAYLLLNNLNEASLSCRMSLTVAEKSNYSRCIAVSKAYLACVEIRHKNVDTALDLVKSSIMLVADDDLSLPSLLSIAVYVHRVTGNAEQAKYYSDKVIAISNNQPITLAFTYYQMALLEATRGNRIAETRLTQKALQILHKLKLTRWIDRIKRQS